MLPSQSEVCVLSQDNNKPLCTIEIEKQAMNFSIGHFTIFSSTERENLHGHNYQLVCEATAPLGDDGLMFDYAVLKKLLKRYCDEIDEKMALPEFSPHLKLGETELPDLGHYVTAKYADETLLFLARDVIVLPVANVTVEALSQHFLDKICSAPELENRGIVHLKVKVSSSAGQYGVAQWYKTQ